MPIISFWSQVHGQGGNTSNLTAAASVIALEYAIKTMITHTHWSHSTLESSFIKNGIIQENSMLNFSDNGIDALERLARSHRLTPEIIHNYTNHLIEGRLALLIGTTKPDSSLYENLNDVIKEIFACAHRYYELLLIDVHSGSKNQLTNTILKDSDLIVVCLNQNVNVINRFFSKEDWPEALHEKPFVITIGQYDKGSKYSIKNIIRKYKPDVPVYPIPYCTGFKDACNDQDVLGFFRRVCNNSRSHESYYFIQEIRKFTKAILDKSGVDTDLKYIERGAS